MLSSTHASSRAAGLSTTAARRPGRHVLLSSPSTVALARSRHRQQCRSFGFGPWSRNCESDAFKESRRRHRALKYRHMESLSRRLSWENKPRHDPAKAAMKSAFAAHVARAPGGKSSKYVNIDDVKSWSDEFSGVRPGRNIEDVEREAIDHLFSGGKSASSWASSLHTVRSYLHGKRGLPEEVTPESVLHATTTADESGFAGSKPSTAKDSPKTGGSSGPKYEDLGKYAPKDFDDPNAPRKLTPEERSKQYKDLDKYKPVEWNEPDGLQKPTPEEESKKYKDLHKYASPDVSSEIAPDTTSAKPYYDLDKYKPVEWNEPDGLRQLTPEELSKQYDDLDKYDGPVTWHEPDGLRVLTPEELSKNYDDLDKYGPVTWNEPDGLRRLTPEEKSKQYTDLDSYSEGFVADNAVLKAHELQQQDPTPKAEPIPAKVDVPVEEPGKDYKDLHKYGPVRWNEPDGLRKLTPEELSKNYEDLHKYEQYPNAGPATPRIHPEEASKQYSDLRKYDAFPNDGPTTERVHPEEASKQYKDLSKYPRAGFEEPDKIKHVHPEELTKNYQDLDKYKPTSFDSPDRAYPLHPEEKSKQYKDLGSYKPVMVNEPDGKAPASTSSDPVAQGLKAYDSSGSAGQGNETEGLFKSADDIRADVLRRAYRNSKRTMLQRATLQQDQNSNVAAPDAQDGVGKTKAKVAGSTTLTGNYARDFPEEFATSWSTSNSLSKSTLFPKNLASAEASANVDLDSAKEESGFSSMDESFPSEEVSKLQPALDRPFAKRASAKRAFRKAMTGLERMRVEEDPYSKHPQGLETDYAEECGGIPTWPTFVRHHKAKPTKEAEGIDTAAEPVSYKMLAYDPSTQSISVAETTSGVLDTSSPATPADVLLRLSNPSKFFPYFSALQAEGYEMVTGGSDVLVFRKVRSGTASGISAGDWTGSAINPIDMMGRSAASNFASPTGFVNYDQTSYQSTSRAESSESTQQPTVTPRKKRSLPRKLLIGTVWVAGTAYAVGVVGEFFATGGKVF